MNDVREVVVDNSHPFRSMNMICYEACIASAAFHMTQALQYLQTQNPESEPGIIITIAAETTLELTENFVSENIVFEEVLSGNINIPSNQDTSKSSASAEALTFILLQYEKLKANRMESFDEDCEQKFPSLINRTGFVDALPEYCQQMFEVNIHLECLSIYFYYYYYYYYY